MTLLWAHDCSSPGSPVPGISQAKILEGVAIAYSRGSSQPKDPTRVSRISRRFFTTEPPGKPDLIKCKSVSQSHTLLGFTRRYCHGHPREGHFWGFLSSLRMNLQNYQSLKQELAGDSFFFYKEMKWGRPPLVWHFSNHYTRITQNQWNGILHYALFWKF